MEHVSSAFSINLLRQLQAISVDLLCINQRVWNLFTEMPGPASVLRELAENHQGWWLRIPQWIGVL